MSTAWNTALRPSAPVQPVKRVPGEEGTWVFIYGDMMIFAVIFVTYLRYRGQQIDPFNDSQETLVREFGAANTFLLLTSSLFVAVGIRAINKRRADLAPLMFIGAMAYGLAFAAFKFVEYGEKLSVGITPATNNFYMYYFVLTGHFFHLIVRMAILALITRASSRTAHTAKQYALIEGGACSGTWSICCG